MTKDEQIADLTTRLAALQADRDTLEGDVRKLQQQGYDRSVDAGRRILAMQAEADKLREKVETEIKPYKAGTHSVTGCILRLEEYLRHHPIHTLTGRS